MTENGLHTESPDDSDLECLVQTSCIAFHTQEPGEFCLSNTEPTTLRGHTQLLHALLLDSIISETKPTSCWVLSQKGFFFFGTGGQGGCASSRHNTGAAAISVHIGCPTCPQTP